MSHIYSEHFSNLSKSSGGCPVKLSSANINYDWWVICMGKVDNAVQMAKALQDVTNQFIFAQTVHCQLKSNDMRPVMKRKLKSKDGIC